jgi:hypothetical protein
VDGPGGEKLGDPSRSSGGDALVLTPPHHFKVRGQLLPLSKETERACSFLPCL